MSAGAQRRAPVSSPSNDISTGVVLVRVVNAAGDTIIGNGVVVGRRDQVVIERSLLVGAAAITVTSASTTVAARVVASDSALGVAVLETAGLPVTPVRMATQAAVANDSVLVVTLEPDRAATINRARVKRVERFAEGPMTNLSIDITPETNGAPVTRMNGDLLGIAFTASANGASQTYGIPVQSFARLLAKDAAQQVVAATPPPAPTPTTRVAPAAPQSSVKKTSTAPAIAVKDYDKVHACDDAAAHPEDPQRMATGVKIDNVVPRLALQACQAAVAEHPGAPRFHYQLARALIASRRYDEAIDAYNRAAAMGYPMAWMGLGIAYGEGQGVPVDLAKAEEYLRKAVAAGAPPAATLLAQYVFTDDGYSSPALFSAIYAGRLAEANPGPLASYFGTFLGRFRATDGCQNVVSESAILGIGQHASMSTLGQFLASAANAPTGNTLEQSARSGYEAGAKMSRDLVARVDKANEDAQLFYSRHGCASPVAKTFFANLDRYARALGNPSLMKELERNGAGRRPPE